ncbi:hypothetical protein DY000_02017624 [Brassica cretica]|uniref:Uncharacterized protein n=1 Tax=Brassica cretica TaxID=69181 RepID=A0ABQ7D2Y0_BRACR|nr:hypothetical protein DY000_02017624 [Brassica cretica]
MLGRYVATKLVWSSVATLRPSCVRARMGVYEYSIRTYSVPFFSRNRMIDSPSRFEDDTWTVIWLFPGSELDMRGDRFSIFGEFRSFCLFSVLPAHFPFLFLCMFAFFDIGVYPLKLDIYLPNDEDSKENAKEDLFRPHRSLRSEWTVGLSSVAT